MDVWRDTKSRPAHDPSWSVGSLVDGWSDLDETQQAVLLDRTHWDRRTPLSRKDVDKIISQATKGDTSNVG
jgi:hypothetical protein